MPPKRRQAFTLTVTLGAVATSGRAATASHVASSKICSISIGGTGTQEGVPVCH